MIYFFKLIQIQYIKERERDIHLFTMQQQIWNTCLDMVNKISVHGVDKA
jgi:hypothetical protein